MYPDTDFELPVFFLWAKINPVGIMVTAEVITPFFQTLEVLANFVASATYI